MTIEVGAWPNTGETDVATAVAIAVRLSREGLTNALDLGEHLYATWYARPMPADGAGRTDRATIGLPGDLAAVFRAAHAASGRWEDGWHVERVGPAGMIDVRRGPERRVLYRADYLVPGRPGLAAQIGDRVLASARRDVVDPDRSWWRTRGAAWTDGLPPSRLVRLYWAVDLETLPRLIRLLTSVLDRLDVPWSAKAAVDPALHARPDAIVAYVPGAALASIAPEIEAVRSAIEGAARATRPPFTLPVAPGLSIADDPGRHQSFGEHRCRLVAEGVLAAAPSFAEAEVGAAVAARFGAAGIDPRRPWAATPALLPWERA